jgi:acyl dehydratase
VTMALDKKHIGRRYGPFVYEAGVEKMREFAWAVGGTIPSTGFTTQGAPVGLHPWLTDQAAAQSSPYGAIIAMPNFAVVFAIGPFGRACADPEVGVDLLRLVHGDQEFEFFEPVKAGDVLTTSGEIADVSSKAGLDFLVVTTESTNQRGELVVKGRWTAVIRGAKGEGAATAGSRG